MQAKYYGMIVSLCLVIFLIIPQSYARQIPGALAGLEPIALQEVTDEEAAAVRGEAWSPNGLPAGQCTWYVDGKVYKDGWRLKFSQNYGRHAYKWWDLVTNANKGQLGLHGDIMVLNKWDGNQYGHVAYVESSTPGQKWDVSHANWYGNYKTQNIDGKNYKIYYGTYKKVSEGKVNYNGGSSKYPLRGRPYPLFPRGPAGLRQGFFLFVDSQDHPVPFFSKAKEAETHIPPGRVGQGNLFPPGPF